MIRYTDDFSDPNEESTVYTGPIEPTENCIYKAYATLEGFTDSDVSRYAFRRHEHTVPTPRFSVSEGMVTIHTNPYNRAEIRYTTDGSDPTPESTLYTGPFSPGEDCIIKAYGTLYNFYDSAIGEYDMKMDVLAVPTARFEYPVLWLSHPDPAATIYYTIDNTDVPAYGIEYDPTTGIELDGGLHTVYFMARRPGWNDSPIDKFIFEDTRLSMPSASYSAHAVWLVHEDPEVTILYTLDADTKPSLTYDPETGVPVDADATVRFKAVRDAYIDSPVGNYEFRIADWQLVAPVFIAEYADAQLRIGSQSAVSRHGHLEVEGTAPFWTLVSQSTDLIEYEDVAGVSEMTEPTVVTAAFVADDPDFYDSEPVTFTVEYASRPALVHHGRTLEVADMEIFEILDWEGPEWIGINAGTRYDAETLRALDWGALFALTVRASNPTAEEFPSVACEYSNDSFFDPTTGHYGMPTAGVRRAGILAEAFSDETPDDTLAVIGAVDGVDLSALGEVAGALEMLDLEKARIETADTDELDLSLPYLKTLVLPSDLASGLTIEGTERLTALEWRGESRMPEVNAGNPNLLVYAERTDRLPTSLNDSSSRRYAAGVVREGGEWGTDALVLTPGHPFGAPYPFTAAYAEVRKEFGQQTPMGGCEGWETIAVPFDVETVTLASDGTPLKPFAALGEDDGETHPYWLYAADLDAAGRGWKSASAILAGYPYLISMPNNPQYGEEWNISGEVVFAAHDVMVSVGDARSGESVAMQDGSVFHALFTIPEEDTVTFGLNAWLSDIPAEAGVDEALTDNGYYRPGSVFHASVTPRPFEAYFTADISALLIPVWGGTSGIDAPYVPTTHVAVVYNTQGVAVRKVEVGPVTWPDLEGLVPGIYIIEGRKYVTR